MRVDWGLFQNLFGVLVLRDWRDWLPLPHVFYTWLACVARYIDFVVISCHFNVNMCMAWERNDDQQISNTLSLRLLEEVCSASLIALIGTCACWAWYACIGWKSIQDHSSTSLHFIKGFVHVAAICKLAPQSVVVWHHVVWGDMMCHVWVPVMIFETN